MSVVSLAVLPLSIDLDLVDPDEWDKIHNKYSAESGLAESKEYKTCIIGFDFSDDDYIQNLRSSYDSSEAVDSPHLTILSIGETSDLNRENLLAKLADFAKSMPEVHGTFNGFATFAPDPTQSNRTASVMLFDSPELMAFRQELARVFSVDLPVPNHGFTPHVTLAYTTGPLHDPSFTKHPVTVKNVTLYWNGSKTSFPLTGFTPLEWKGLPIDEDSKKLLISLRVEMFGEISDGLADKVFTGEISIGTWEESMRKAIRELHASVASISKGGWDQMTPADWGRLGNPLKEQYRYLHKFAATIAEKKDTISIQAIRARSRMYGNAGGVSGTLTQAGHVIENLLPWLPKDGSTECLVNCRCRWELTVLDTVDDFQLVQAVWKLGEAEHCHDCVGRDGYTTIIRVHVSVAVPKFIGGF